MSSWKIKIKLILRGLDLWLAVVVAIALFVCVPNHSVLNVVAKDLYGIGMSILSVIFSVFIAALAIIMSSGSDDFIDFLEAEGHFTLIVWGLKFTLGLLFVALIISIVFYSLTSFWIGLKYEEQSVFWLSVYSFFAMWSLLATFQSAISSILYSQYRIKFIRITKASAKDKK